MNNLKDEFCAPFRKRKREEPSTGEKEISEAEYNEYYQAENIKSENDEIFGEHSTQDNEDYDANYPNDYLKVKINLVENDF